MRFGLLGTGYWAAEIHGAGLAAHPGTELVGVWGRDPAKAQALATALGARAYREIDALLSDVEAVAVALPPDVQAGLAVRAAGQGRHLLLDKPLALGLDAADRVVAAATARRVRSVVFFTGRFHANVEAFLAEAATRPWAGARATMFASIFEPGNPFGGSPWRREYGGLWDIGPHALSMTLPVLGQVGEVAAMDGPHDTAYALLRHTGGATSTMALTLDAPSAATTREIVFYGEPGVAVVPEGDTTVPEAFARAVDALLADAVSADAPGHPCDVRFAREVVAVLAAVDRARRTGRTTAVQGP